MNIIVDDLMTNYQVTGKGKLVLLLHGWGDTAQGLAGLQLALAEKYQVLSLDLPGFGGTQPPQAVWDLDNYADFVGKLLKKLDLKQPYAVLGHSNGGAVAIRAISLGDLKPQKLILMSASGIRTGKTAKRLVLKVLAKTGNVATIWMPERYRQALRKSLYGAAGSDMLVAPQLQETFKKTVRQDVQEDAANLTTQTLLIYADKDRAVPLTDGETYNRLIKNSKLAVIEGVGHFAHQERPAEIVKIIKEFLA